MYPKYLEMEKRFKQLEEELKFEEKIMKKNHKIEMVINHKALKAH
jgi:hypothetical protein